MCDAFHVLSNSHTLSLLYMYASVMSLIKKNLHYSLRVFAAKCLLTIFLCCVYSSTDLIVKNVEISLSYIRNSQDRGRHYE